MFVGEYPAVDELFHLIDADVQASESIHGCVLPVADYTKEEVFTLPPIFNKIHPIDNDKAEIIDEEDAFHLDLSKFKMPQRVIDDLEKLAKNNIIIELYDANKHYGLEEFYEEIQSEPFERVIRYNLSLKEPKPFAVVVKDNKVYGWTGAFYTEPSGRAHFDGIIVAPHVRGNGLGRALFATLAQYSKENGSSFMTFFTGRTNFARYIYLSLGFKIIQSFAVMEKEIN